MDLLIYLLALVNIPFLIKIAKEGSDSKDTKAEDRFSKGQLIILAIVLFFIAYCKYTF